MNKYVAFDAENHEFELFETFKEAEEWLRESYGDSYSEYTCDGFDFIAKITHRSKFIETDCKENYHEHNGNCPGDCDEEEWDHECDTVGIVEFEEVKD